MEDKVVDMEDKVVDMVDMVDMYDMEIKVKMRMMIMMIIKRMKSDPPYTPPYHSLLDRLSPPDNYPLFLPLLPFPAPLLAYHLHLLAFLLPLVLLLLQHIGLPITLTRWCSYGSVSSLAYNIRVILGYYREF
jgi:hypothetical protein